MVDKDKAFEVARRIDILMKRAERKEGILLDDWVDLFREYNRNHIELWMETNNQLEEIRDTIKGMLI